MKPCAVQKYIDFPVLLVCFLPSKLYISLYSLGPVANWSHALTPFIINIFGMSWKPQILSFKHPGLTHISNFTLFHLVLSAVLFFLVSICMTSFYGVKIFSQSRCPMPPYPKSRRPGEPLTSDDLEIAKKLDPKVPNSMGKWHHKNTNGTNKKNGPFGNGKN